MRVILLFSLFGLAVTANPNEKKVFNTFVNVVNLLCCGISGSGASEFVKCQATGGPPPYNSTEIESPCGVIVGKDFYNVTLRIQYFCDKVPETDRRAVYNCITKNIVQKVANGETKMEKRYQLNKVCYKNAYGKEPDYCKSERYVISYVPSM